MQRYDRSQVIRFLHALDFYLKEDLGVFVVGGLAAVLGYNADIKTADMDVYALTKGSDSDMKRAWHAAAKLTGINFMLGKTTVTDLPYDYEDRIRKPRGARFERLEITVPDKYDLVLSKAVRCYPHDLEAILSMHQHHPLAEKTLVMRFEKEMWKFANTDPKNYAMNMIAVIRMLFGEGRVEFYKNKWELAPPG